MTCLWKGLEKPLPRGLSAIKLRSEGGIWQSPADTAVLRTTITNILLIGSKKLMTLEKGPKPTENSNDVCESNLISVNYIV